MRVTPDFRDDELVARGVQIEALSVEDNGESLCLNVYCYNIQPGVIIDYATGESRLESDTETSPIVNETSPCVRYPPLCHLSAFFNLYQKVTVFVDI